MVQRNGARGVVDAKVHTPSGSSEECYVTELDSGTRQPYYVAQTIIQGYPENFIKENRLVTSPTLLFCFQTRVQSALFRGRMAFTP